LVSFKKNDIKKAKNPNRKKGDLANEISRKAYQKRKQISTNSWSFNGKI